MHLLYNYKLVLIIKYIISSLEKEQALGLLIWGSHLAICQIHVGKRKQKILKEI